jgi:aspartyl-tRNA(Asn)/glutamyl-tRNA(Gln) amidotransferase subunit C
MAKLTIQDVIRIAELNKIALSELELEKFREQLNTVLDSVSVLKELDTDKITETSQTHGLENVLAEDESRPGLEISKYPNKKNLKNNYFVVKRVIS